jgi:hypothetical protein
LLGLETLGLIQCKKVQRSLLCNDDPLGSDTVARGDVLEFVDGKRLGEPEMALFIERDEIAVARKLLLEAK